MKCRPVYKCALCGEKHFGDIVYLNAKVFHNCADGSIGMAPFIGFKMEVDLDEEEEGLADDE